MKFNLKIVAATAAVAMMSSGAASAGTVSATPASTYSKEGLTLTGTGGVQLPKIVVVFGNALTYQDDIVITIPGVVPIAPTALAGLVTCTTILPAPALPPSVGFVQTVANGWQFRVTSVAGVTIGDTCTIGTDATVPPAPPVAANRLTVQGASLATATNRLDYNAYRFFTGQLVDSGTNSASITVKSQFALTVPGAALIPAAPESLNGEIDVNFGRTQFSPGTFETIPPGDAAADPLRADTLNFNTTVDGNGQAWTGPTVTTTAQVVTISGDFAWVDANSNGTCTTTEFGTRLIGYAGWSVDSTLSNCTKVVLNGPAGVAIPVVPPAVQTGNTTNLGYFYVPGNKVLSPQDWLGEVEWTYSLGILSQKLKTNWDPGFWTINGAQVYIQYMPYGTGVSRIIYAANAGTLAAEVDADIFADGVPFQCSLGDVAGQTVTQLSGVIDACVAGKGITSGKVAILLTFTAPKEMIEVYSAYNVGGNDRGTVVNTSNGRGVFYYSQVD